MGEAMATGVVTGEGVHGIPFDEIHRMTVNEYERLADSGILDDPQVELINGLLVQKMTRKPRHVSACELVAGALEALLPEGWYIREQNPLRIPDYDEPEPDIVIARGSRGRQIEVYSEPDRTSGGYARCVVHAASDSVPLEIEDAEAGRVAVSERPARGDPLRPKRRTRGVHGEGGMLQSWSRPPSDHRSLRRSGGYWCQM